MPHSPQAFSVPSMQMSASNPRGDLNSIASISASSTISITSSEPSASKPRDPTLKREQNPRYSHDNGLIWGPKHLVDPGGAGREHHQPVEADGAAARRRHHGERGQKI